MKNGIRTLAMLLVAVLALSTLAGCASDADKIVGTWKTNVASIGSVSIETTYVFNADGTGHSSTAGVVLNYTYTVADGKLSVSNSILGVVTTTEYTYTLDGDTLTLVENGKATVLTRS